MRISHATRIDKIDPMNGYGYATDRMISSLNRLGHEVKQNDPDAPVAIWFDQPLHWKWNDNDQYRIGYHPWESTKLLDNWVDMMNECDEIWTPSPLIAEWYARDGIKAPIYVYQHGIDPIWTPKKRKIDDGKIKFLHVGWEAARKGNDMLKWAFNRAFVGRDDVTLTLKMMNPGWNVPRFGKVTEINQKYTLDQMVELYHSHHVYVYPSHGEGFGLTPLQAMATGMPTITVPDWAPYRKYLNPNLNIEATLKNSKWPEIHPGKMFRPNRDDLVDRMRYAANNYEECQDFAFDQLAGIKQDYDWDLRTKDTFDSLEKRLSNK